MFSDNKKTKKYSLSNTNNKVLAAAAVLFFCMSAQSNAVEWNTQSELAVRNTAHMAVSDQTLPPIGFVNFCAVNGDECKRPNPVSLPMRMTNKRWLQLVDVNEAYNRAIEPVTDLEQYKVAEYWTYPGTRGDCEDYVLAKKRRLIELGWPPSALLITVARDQNGDGHAVLTAATDIGDFILDNQSDEILPWKDTPYAYVKRQSQSHPYIWVSLDGKGQTRSASIVDVLGLRR